MVMKKHMPAAVAAAWAGLRVVVLSNSQIESRLAFVAARDMAPAGGGFRSAAGAERITAPSGGSVRFRSIGSRGHRGLSADRVYLPAAAASYESVILDMLPLLATSADGQIIGCL